MEGQDQGDELYPIAVLIDELKVRNNQGALLWGIIRTLYVWPLTHDTARRCSSPFERHSQTLHHRPRFGPRAHS
jgi:hypothetical protein